MTEVRLNSLQPLLPNNFRQTFAFRSRSKSRPNIVPINFQKLEEDISSIQTQVDAVKKEVLSDSTLAIYQGKIKSRKHLGPVARQLSEIHKGCMTVAEVKQTAMNHALNDLLEQTIGQSKIKCEMLKRCLVLKIRLQGLVLRKLSELAVLSLARIDGGEYLGELRPITCVLELFKRALGENEMVVESFKVQRLEDEISRLNEIVASKIEQIDSMKKAEGDSYNQQVEGFRQRILDQEGHIQKCNANIVQMQKTIDDKDAQLKELCFENEQLKYIFRDSLKEHCQLIERQQRIIDGLKVQLGQTQQKYEELFEKVQRDQKAGHQANIQIQQLQETLSQIQSKYQSLLQTHEILELQHNSHQEQQNGLQNELDWYQQDITNYKTELKTAQHTINKYIVNEDQLQKRIAALENQIEALELQQIRPEVVKKLESEAFALKETANIWERQLKMSESQKTRLKSQLNDSIHSINLLNSQIETLKSQLEASQRIIASLEQELEGGEDDTYENVLRNELNMMRNRYEEQLSALRSRLAEMQKEGNNKKRQLTERAKKAEHAANIAEQQLQRMITKG